MWGAPGKKAATLDAFFTAALPADGAKKIEAVSMDLGPAFARSVRAHAPQAVICFDPFHVVKLATDALDDVRRQVWQSARKLSDKQIAKTYKRSVLRGRLAGVKMGLGHLVDADYSLGLRSRL